MLWSCHIIILSSSWHLTLMSAYIHFIWMWYYMLKRWYVVQCHILFRQLGRRNDGISWLPSIPDGYFRHTAHFSCLKSVWRPPTLPGGKDLCMQAKRKPQQSQLFLSGIMKRKKSDQEKGRSTTASPGGVSDGLHTDCCGKQHSSEAFKAWRERHRQRESEERRREGETEGEKERERERGSDLGK